MIATADNLESAGDTDDPAGVADIAEATAQPDEAVQDNEREQRLLSFLKMQARDAMIESIRGGADLSELADRVAGGSLVRLAEGFERFCEHRTLRNLLRMQQYHRAFKLEGLKLEAINRLMQIATGALLPSSSSPEEIREINLQMRAISMLLRINSFPTARETREDLSVRSDSGEPVCPDWTEEGLIRQIQRELRRGDAAAQALSREIEREAKPTREVSREIEREIERDAQPESVAEPRQANASNEVQCRAAPDVEAAAGSNHGAEVPHPASAGRGAQPGPQHGMNDANGRAAAAPKGSSAPPRPSRVQLTGGGSFLRSVNGLGVLNGSQHLPRQQRGGDDGEIGRVTRARRGHDDDDHPP